MLILGFNCDRQGRLVGESRYAVPDEIEASASASSTVGTPAPTVRDNGEGEVRWFYGGGVMTTKASAAETGAAFLVWEDVMDGGKVTPLHQHPDADETFYMLRGRDPAAH